AVSRTPTGILYNGAQLNQYDVQLPSPCILTHGWVSIVGFGDPTCSFYWMTSSAGDHLSYCDTCRPSIQSTDMSFCLQGVVGGVFGACCNDASASCTDAVEINQCAASTQRFAANQSCSGLNPLCGAP